MESPHIERRKSADKWVYIARGLAISSWLCFIVAIVVSYYAAPENNYGLLRFKNIDIRDTWAFPFTHYLYGILWLSAGLSVLCLLLNNIRARRKQDSHHFNLVLLLLTIAAWFVYIFFDLP